MSSAIFKMLNRHLLVDFIKQTILLFEKTKKAGPYTSILIWPRLIDVDGVLV